MVSVHSKGSPNKVLHIIVLHLPAVKCNKIPLFLSKNTQKFTDTVKRHHKKQEKYQTNRALLVELH